MSQDPVVNENPKPSLKNLIDQEISSYLEKRVQKEPITISDFWDLLEADPQLAQLSHQRLYSAVGSRGYEDISFEVDPRRAKLLELEPGFVMRVPKLFTQRLYGIEKVLFSVDNYLYMAAGQGEASRQMLYFWGPPGSGKTTLAEIMRRVLEEHGFWQLQDCEHHDNPVDATPRHLRAKIFEDYGIFIDPRADICPKCRKKLTGEYGNDYRKFKVEWKTFSQRKSCGIAVVSEVDPINFNMAVMIGEEDISKLGDYKRGDPETLILNGAFSRGKRGINEIVEIWKNPVEAQRPLLTQTQERYVPLPKFTGQVYSETVIISHSNETEWRKFKSDPTNEATMNRIYVVKVPHNLRLTEEVQIYKNSFLDRSLNFRNIHIDPHSLEQVAMFVLFTRMDNKNSQVEPLVKIKIYDGQDLTSSGEPVNITLSKFGELADPKEGMVGLSYRDATKSIIEESLAYYRCFWEKDEYLSKCGGYLNPLWLHKAMVRYVQESDIPKDAEWPRAGKKQWLSFIQDDLYHELLESLKTDVILAHLKNIQGSFQKTVDYLLGVYTDNLIRSFNKEPVDEDFVKSVEEKLLMSESEKQAFRSEMAKAAFSLKVAGESIDSSASGKLKFSLETLARQNIMRSIAQKLGDHSEKTRLIEAMTQIGYAKIGAETVLEHVARHA